jgi:hypothetical protein
MRLAQLAELRRSLLIAVSIVVVPAPVLSQTLELGVGLGATHADMTGSESVPFTGLTSFWLNGDVQLRFRRVALQVGVGHWLQRTPSTSLGQPETLYREEYDIHGDVIFLFPPPSKGRVTPYIGIGSGVHVAKDAFDQVLRLPDGRVVTFRHEDQPFETGFAVNVLAGVEGHVAKKLQLFGAVRFDAADIGGETPFALIEWKLYGGLRWQVH